MVRMRLGQAERSTAPCQRLISHCFAFEIKPLDFTNTSTRVEGDPEVRGRLPRLEFFARSFWRNELRRRMDVEVSVSELDLFRETSNGRENRDNNINNNIYK